MVVCSECWHVEVKPIVAIDLDGTIADYHGSLFRFAEQWFGVLDTNWANTYHGQVKLARHMGVTDDESEIVGEKERVDCVCTIVCTLGTREPITFGYGTYRIHHTRICEALMNTGIYKQKCSEMPVN